MANYLKLMSAGREDRIFALHDAADPAEDERLLVEADPDDVVRVPARMNDQIRETALYLRTGRWDAWQVVSHDPEQPE